MSDENNIEVGDTRFRYVDAECHIVIPPSGMSAGADGGRGQGLLGILTGAEPAIPTDEEITATFPDWKAKGKIFCYRCLREEGRDPLTVDAQDMFRYGMKFLISEAKKLG